LRSIERLGREKRYRGGGLLRSWRMRNGSYFEGVPCIRRKFFLTLFKSQRLKEYEKFEKGTGY
jgi:hypothetical protein